MFPILQQHTWTISHLTGCAWYLNCAPSFSPSFGTELKKSKEDVDQFRIEMLDLHGIEDENESAKAMKRCIISGPKENAEGQGG